jgi:alpha-L-fucosidase
VRTLVTCAGGDGNLLLNVGPMPTGEIEVRQADRLREVGGWLKVNGEAVYGTRGGPFLPGSWGVSTHRERNVYVHVLRWPTDDALVLPALERRIVGASVVGVGGAAEATQSAAGTTIRVAAAHRQPIDTVVRLELDGPAGTLAPR